MMMGTGQVSWGLGLVLSALELHDGWCPVHGLGDCEEHGL